MTIDNATNAVAASAVASPWWLPSLASMSETASMLLPILGATWLVVQIVVKIREHGRE